MTLATATKLTVKIGNTTVLHNVDFSIEQGEILTVVGPNGSGKTTLLRALIGALRPASGKIWHKPGLNIGYVPQRLNINATLPITVNRFLSLPRKRKADDIAKALDNAGVSTLADHQMSQLSGGQFQRVLLARALLEQPQLLILDEPTTGLDQPGSAAMYQQIEQIRSNYNCAVLMVSHELHVVMSASDRVICLNGHVCCHGTPAVVASAPEYRALFGSGTQGALALYRHDHDHNHDHNHTEAAE
ncbi:metal ABC transporter ATP-binding protein [Parasulfitobacter algicola]|uniref:Metal ABC transporter ATP-binding protein n=1 Tax=Parasulfitobacter algicola TaxID=2614809 RepID=A0ABX2INE3_9RHOB|nr:metal ABC transporter ATP-binding protein [Sulfitobacter algicola]NSX54409.1 metal ABC transporter ATP-binding protein [Sulfitobacter algicola]